MWIRERRADGAEPEARAEGTGPKAKPRAPSRGGRAEGAEPRRVDPRRAELRWLGRVHRAEGAVPRGPC